MKNIRNGWLAAVLAGCGLAHGASLTLAPVSGGLSGLPGTTVGWGFTISHTGTWIEVTSAAFCTGTSGTNTLCTAATIGVFTDYISAYNDIVVGPAPDTTSVTQAFSLPLHQGVAGFQITAYNGQTGPGQIVLTYNVFSRSPHDPAFNPDTDTVSTDNFLTAPASVTVNVSAASGAPALGPWGTALLALLLAGFPALLRRHAS